jgi:xanthine phosphoribosyltransferase
MNALVNKIRQEAAVLPGGLLKVDGFLNHRLEPALTLAMGEQFATRFANLGVEPPDLIVTVEASGIAPAFTTAMAYGAPMVYARKRRPLTMGDAALEATVASRTRGNVVTLALDGATVGEARRVLIIDDFLASGKTIAALAGLVEASGSQVVGVGGVIEKSYEEGRERLAALGVPIVTLAIVDQADDVTGEVQVRSGD